MNDKLEVPFSPTIDFERFGKMLGVDRQFWIKKESKKGISFSLDLDYITIKQIEFQPIKDILEHFGNSVSIDISIGSLIIYSNKKNSNISTGRFNQIIKEIAPDATVTLKFEINKYNYVKKYYAKILSPRDKTLVIYFVENLENLLKDRDIKVIQENIWDCKPKNSWDEVEKADAFERISKKVIVIVPDADLYCKCSDFLLIIGGKYLTVQQFKKTEHTNLSVKNNCRSIYDTCQENLKWQLNKHILITPWHFHVSEYGSESSGLVHLLRQHFFNLFILYTADRTVFSKRIDSINNYRAIYCGSNQQADFILRDPWQEGQLSITDENAGHLLQIINFVYENKKTASDKIIISQLVIMDHIIGMNNIAKVGRIIEYSASILEKVKWQWKMLAEGKIRQNWKQIQEIETDIHNIIRNFSDQISTLVSKLVEVVWSGIIVTLGSFLAAIFSSDFNTTIIRVGLLTYAIYLLVFPLTLSMLNHWQVYQTTIRQFESQRKEFQKSLPLLIVDKLVTESEYDRNRKGFISWFIALIIIYIVIIALLIIGAYFVPKFVS
jgi:hypothetical protein